MKYPNPKKFAALCCAGLAGLLCACINVDYTQAAEFPPLPEDIRVVTYYENSQFPVPEKERILVGDVTAEASTASYTLAEIKQKLVRTARKHGANAILVLSIDHKFDGRVRSDQVKNMSTPSWTPVDTSASDIQEQHNMDSYVNGKDGTLPVYRITVKAQFYKIPDQAHARERIIVPDAPPEPGSETAVKKQDAAINIHSNGPASEK